MAKKTAVVKMKRVPAFFHLDIDTIAREIFAGRTLAESTRKGYVFALADFLTWVKFSGTRDCFARWRDHLDGYKDKSYGWKNRRFVVAKHFIHYCIRNGYIKRDITAGVRGLKQDEVYREHYTERMVNKLFAIVDEEDDEITRGAIGSMLALMAYNGLRANEVLSLRREDVFLDVGVMRVRRKGGRMAEVEMADETMEYLGMYLGRVEAVSEFSNDIGGWIFPRPRANQYGQEQLKYGSFSSILKPWLKRAGMGTKLHRLRAFAITRVYRVGGWRSAKEFAGHANMGTTEVYLPAPAAREVGRTLRQLSQWTRSNKKRAAARKRVAGKNKVVKRGKKGVKKKRGQGRGPKR